MKALSFVLLFFSFNLSLYSQQTLWGTIQKGGLYNHGVLYKTDSIGDNLVVVHNFDSIRSGKFPGAIIQASNGKIYGTTNQGGNGVVQSPGAPPGYYTEGGTLFEYDPVLDSFRILIHFNSTNALYPAGFYSPSPLPLLEAAPGKLWITLSLFQYSNSVAQVRHGSVMSYDLATGVLSPVATVPSWTTPSLNGPQYTSISGPLYKGADGYVYGMTNGYSSCAVSAAANDGSLIRINPATNAFSYILPLNCSYIDGWLPEGNFEEVNGKYIGRTRWGGPAYSYPTAPGNGVIFEFDPVANTYTKKYNLQGGTMGRNVAGNTIKAANGKLYAAAYGGVTNNNMPYGGGIIYEYDAASNTYNVDYNFLYTGALSSIGTEGQLWVKGSNHKLYGTTSLGVFEFNTSNNQARAAGRFSMTNYTSLTPNLITVCKKPSYKYISVLSHTLCTGTSFHYDLHSYNANSFVWKHNGITEASQTSGILHINQVSASDAGTWVCEMTNACGVTTSQTVTLTVNPAGIGVITSTITAAGSTTICPGSVITLSGNTNGGVWSNGSTATSVAVGGPASYHVSNSNACGLTFSNIITIDTIPTPARSVISFTSTSTMPTSYANICPGDSVLAFGNVNGTWNTGETSPSLYVKDALPHYIINSNACAAVYSGTIQAHIIPPVISPTITALGPVSICSGDSVLLQASGIDNYDWYIYNGLFTNYVDHNLQVYAKQSGDYYIIQQSYCGPVHSQTIHVNANETALDTAIITPLSSTVICPGTSVILESNYTSCSWNTGATTQTIAVTQAGTYQVMNYNSCSTVTSAAITVSVIATPFISFTQSQDSVCLTTAPFNLDPGIPAGGYYMGTGVSGTSFNPSLAGSGTHTVTYNYDDTSTGCTASTLQVIYVDHDPVIATASSTLICQGSNTVLYQVEAPYGIWNTGATGFALPVYQAGTYYVTKTNVCGISVNSNSIQVSTKPSPTLTINGTTTLCASSNTMLNGNGAVSYSWNPGGNTTQNMTVSPATTTIYTLTGQGSNGCYASMTTTVTVNPAPPLSVNNASICLGNSATLTASGASTYSWSTAQTGYSVVVSPTVSTVYNVLGTSVNSCTSMATAVVQVNSTAVVPTINLVGNVLQSSPSAFYQWYLNGSIITGATSQTYTPTQNGDYTVLIIDAYGCSATSAIHTVLDTGLSGLTGNSIIVDVYPNPTTGHVTLNTPFSKFQVQIVNALGQVILLENGSFISEFNLEESGLYMIHIIANDHIYIKKLVVSGK